MSQTKKVEFFYEAISKLNQEEISLDLLKNVRWQEMEGGPYGGLYYGTSEIFQNVFQKFATDWKRFSFQQEFISESENRVFVVGNYFGESILGKTLNGRVVHLWTFPTNENQIQVKFEQFADTFLLRECLTSESK